MPAPSARRPLPSARVCTGPRGARWPVKGFAGESPENLLPCALPGGAGATTHAAERGRERPWAAPRASPRGGSWPPARGRSGSGRAGHPPPGPPPPRHLWPRLRAKVSEGSDAGVTSLRAAVHIPLFLSPFRKPAPEGLVSFLCLGDPAWSAKTLMIWF